MGLQHILNRHYGQNIFEIRKSQFLSSLSVDDLKMLISLTINEGEPELNDRGWVIEKQHSVMLGHTLNLRGVVKGTTCMRVVLSFTNKLVTAYPIPKF